MARPEQTTLIVGEKAVALDFLRQLRDAVGGGNLVDAKLLAEIDDFLKGRA